MGGDPGLLAAIRQVRARLTELGPAKTRAERDFERISLPEANCDVLRDLLIADRARVVVEIGLAYGSSALAIAEALVSQGHEDAKHVIIDAYQDHFRDAGWEAVTGAGLSHLCSLLRDGSALVLPRLVADGFVADAALVDGSHIFHNVFVDLYFLRELVRPGGLIVLDDCQWPSVPTAVHYFEVNTGWLTCFQWAERKRRRLRDDKIAGERDIMHFDTRGVGPIHRIWSSFDGHAIGLGPG